jgi:hypothetical protein
MVIFCDFTTLHRKILIMKTKIQVKIKCLYGKLKENQREYYNGQRLSIKINKGNSYQELQHLKRFIEYHLREYQGI